MYNSILVGILVKIWKFIEFAYEGSLLKKIVDQIVKFINFLFKGSVVKTIFTKDISLIDESIFMKIYLFFIGLYEKLVVVFNKFFKRTSKESKTSDILLSAFSSIESLSQWIFIFLVSLSLGVILISLKLKVNFGIVHYLLIFLSIVSILGLLLKDKLFTAIINSKFYNFIMEILSIDEGGDQWW